MWASGRIFWKNLESFPKAITTARWGSAAGQPEIPVAIPKRIERGPTDILKALSSTVQRDPTAFPYKYPDDPFFYPFSNPEKRTYALSMESGRKSAKWIVKNNPGFFKNQLSEPPIQAFLPKAAYNEDSDVTEETLLGVIERRDVDDAITVYELLEKKDISLSDHVKQSLLELVCFYNSGEKPSEDELESKWFSNVEHDKVDVNTWKEESFAEHLFESMNQSCPLANSAIIQGMIKYNNVQKALEIFNKAMSNKVKLSVGVYNSLLSQASNTSADIPDGFTFINELLKNMAAEKLHPNLGTLNATLKSVMLLQRLRKPKDYARKLVMEFLHLGVSPSLGTYYYLLRILGQPKKRTPENHKLFHQLLLLIRDTKHEIRHPSDFLFFPQVVQMLSTAGGDIELINLLNDILMKDDNVKFLENSFSESIYFREYICTQFKMEPIEIAMERYRAVVPTMHTPEHTVLSVVLSTIIANNACEYLVEFWEDLKRFRMNRYMKLLRKILPLAKVVKEEATLKVVQEAALSAIEYLEEFGLTRSNQDTVSDLLIALLKTNEVGTALKMFDKAKDFKNTNALLTEDAVTELFQYALAERKMATIMECLRYADDEAHSKVAEMAEMAMPFLGESEQTWATHVIAKAKEKEKVDESSE